MHKPIRMRGLETFRRGNHLPFLFSVLSVLIKWIRLALLRRINPHESRWAGANKHGLWEGSKCSIKLNLREIFYSQRVPS